MSRIYVTAWPQRLLATAGLARSPKRVDETMEIIVAAVTAV
jgi:hypothetical protein